MLAKGLIEMENITREYAQDAARSAQVSGYHLNDSCPERTNVSVLMQRVDILEKKMNELEAATH